MSNISNQKSSLCPAYVLLLTFNGRQTVGDGAFTFDNEPSVLAVCHLQGTEDMYYYSTTFSGGPGQNALQTEGRSPASSSPYQYTDYPPHPSVLSNRNDTDSNASDSPPSSFPHPLSRLATSPRNIPSRTSSNISTPPLTPDDSSDYSGHSGSSIMDSTQKNDALDFLMTVFPHQGLSALPHAKNVSISAPNLGADFDGIVLDLPGTPKTLYVDGKSAASVSLRESIVALLDLADESLGCSALVIVLERSSPNLGSLLHSLMYVGGTVVTKPPFKVDPAFVLVGLEI
ncbi:hypothetical protein BDN70DRAFT_808485 [Pholiota conissans]|uniref:Ornithine decarboxylase antizyme n=1 Tax=Pholiota conissans TaxID=109636 RepID=A0A9P5YZH1_9AGAR|nr:hypothetical protein BDN70DRAFT_808485 [Pholiota conissans]